MAKNLNLKERMAIEFAINNGVPAPRHIRVENEVNVGKFTIKNHWQEYDLLVTTISMFGTISPNGDGKYKLLVAYVDRQYDHGWWSSHDREVRKLGFEIESPYRFGGTREFEFPLSRKFSLKAVNNPGFGFHDHGKETYPSHEGTRLCSICCRPESALEIWVENDFYAYIENGASVCSVQVNMGEWYPNTDVLSALEMIKKVVQEGKEISWHKHGHGEVFEAGGLKVWRGMKSKQMREFFEAE